MKKRTLLSIEIRTEGIDRLKTNNALNRLLVSYDAIILYKETSNYNSLSILELLILVNKNTVQQISYQIQELSKKENFISSSTKTIHTDTCPRITNKENTSQYMLVLLAPQISFKHLSKIIQLIYLQSFDIKNVKQLTNTSSKLTRTSFELSLEGLPVNFSLLQDALKALAKEVNIDYSLQIGYRNHIKPKLICFDMDSTLIQTEVIDELAIHAGVGDEVKKITESAMRGEINFKASFKKRVALLKGLDEAVMIDILNRLPLTEGLEELMQTLKKEGYKIAILSGGFTYFASYLQHKYTIDYMYANALEIIDGKLTGNYIGEIVDGQFKLNKLIEIAATENIDLQQTIAVGDGANDLPMIQAAGLGIAFHAKPKVQAKAEHIINTVGIDGVLYFLGIGEHKKFSL